MQTVEQLIESAKTARLQTQPLWVRNLVRDLAQQLELQTRYAEAVKERAEKEVGEARVLLTGGPADSDTYVELPRAASVYEEDVSQRPLGKGVCIEFRAPGEESGEGITVQRTEGGSLAVCSYGSLAVIPQDAHTLLIAKR